MSYITSNNFNESDCISCSIIVQLHHYHRKKERTAKVIVNPLDSLIIVPAINGLMSIIIL
jgi:hypothetical protein